MTSKYWIKLYHEILDDPKMGRMPDHLWRRTIELFLLAGEQDEEGFLPDLDDMSWRFRIPEDELEAQLNELERLGILNRIDERWYVRKFSQRQAPSSAAKRMQEHRKRKRRALRAGNEPVTNRNAGYAPDTDTDTEAEEEAEKIPPRLPDSPLDAENHPDLQPLRELSVMPDRDDYGLAIDTIRFLRKNRALKTVQELVEYLNPYLIAWKSRVNKRGDPYDPANLGWLTDWAVQEKIPPARVGPEGEEPEHVRLRRELDQRFGRESP